MYEAYFGLNGRPFTSTPKVDLYFPATAIEEARVTLERAVERGEGVGMVIGPSGTGKTLLCRLLARQFSDAFDVAFLTCGRLSTPRNLLQAILYELGQPYRGMDDGECRLALAEFLGDRQKCARGIVLLVDEAHTLSSRLLEELRVLTNLAPDDEPRVRLVLTGGSALEDRLASPRLDSLNQRLVGRCYLESLNRSETEQYVQAQIDSVGGQGSALFTAEVCKSIQQATDGVPRLINQVCDHALLLAYAAGQRELRPRIIDEAWADLQQLPTPWNDESSENATENNVIEFGSLDDGPPTHASVEEPEARPLRISPLADLGQQPADSTEDYLPAGSIGPELELVFDEPDRLLNEEFAEEEAVPDRYSAADKLLGDLAPEFGPLQEVSEPPCEVGVSTERDSDLSEADELTQPREPISLGFDPPHKAVPLPIEPDDSDMIVVTDDKDVPAMVGCPVDPVGRNEFSQLFAKLRRG